MRLADFMHLVVIIRLTFAMHLAVIMHMAVMYLAVVFTIISQVLCYTQYSFIYKYAIIGF